MPALIIVMLGGAVGAGARYLLGMLAVRTFGPAFPWGTLGANLIGGLLMGLLAGLLLRVMSPGSDQLRLLLGVGVLGGFTTFSSFSLETLLMIDRGAYLVALGYVLVSVAGAVGGVQLGRVIGSALL